MTRTAGVHIPALVALVALLAIAAPAGAQSERTDIAALRDSIARRFDILPLRDGVVLRPKGNGSNGVRSIEITRGPVAVNGEPATGAELRDKLGDDADLVLRVSYLSDDERRAFMNGDAGPAAAAAPAAAARAAEPRTAEAPAERSVRRSRSRSDDDRVRIGGGVTVRTGEVVNGSVVAVGGGAEVDGEVHGDVVAVGGSVRLGPNASVSNNVVVVGGTLQRDPAARIEGQVQEIGLGFDLSSLRWPGSPIRASFGPRFGTTLGFVATLTRLAILCLLAALVVLLGRRYAEQAGDRAAIDTVKAGIVGILAQLLFLPVLLITIVVLCITIIGIPLLALIPFALLGLLIVGLVGFTGVAQRIGVLVAERGGLARDSYYTTTILGIVVLLLPVILARFLGLALGGFLFPLTTVLYIAGACMEYLAWTVGFGAVALLRFQKLPGRTAAPTIDVAPAQG